MSGPRPGTPPAARVIPEGAPALASYTDPTVWRLMQAVRCAPRWSRCSPRARRDSRRRRAGRSSTSAPLTHRLLRVARLGRAERAALRADAAGLDRAAASEAATSALFPASASTRPAVECNDSFLDEMQDAVECGSPVILLDAATPGSSARPELNARRRRRAAARSSPRTSCARARIWDGERQATWPAELGMSERERPSTSAGPRR